MSTDDTDHLVEWCAQIAELERQGRPPDTFEPYAGPLPSEGRVDKAKAYVSSYGFLLTRAAHQAMIDFEAGKHSFALAELLGRMSMTSDWTRSGSSNGDKELTERRRENGEAVVLEVSFCMGELMAS